MAIASMERRRFRSERRGKGDVDPVVVNAPRTVMREGPVVLETEKGEPRSQWDLFHEYFKKSEFLLVGEFYGERVAGIIDPVVTSRQGSTNDRPTGDYWNPRQEFRETALMAANLSLLEQGKLSEEEVLRQYDGMYLAGAKIEDLYQTLGRKLGRIKYGEVERRDAIEKRAKTAVAESQSSATTEEVRDAHRFVVDSRAQIVQQAAARSELRAEVKKGKRIKIACALGVASILVSSCAPVIVDMNTVTPDVPIVETVSPGRTSTTVAQSPTETRIPTNTVVPTETATPTPEYEIDMEKFKKIPQDYEYLLTHLDEFVQAPDPLDERDAFERWWNENFLPALGAPIERDVDLIVGGLAFQQHGGLRGVVSEGRPDDYGTLISQPGFFYFEHNGEVFPVPVVDVAMGIDGPYVNFTMAVILFDYLVDLDMSIETSLSLLQEGRHLYSIEIFGSVFPNSSSEAPNEFNENNRLVVDWPNRVVFGFGFIKP